MVRGADPLALRAARRRRRWRRCLDRFLLRLALVGLALALVAVLVSGATNAKDRWLQPVLYVAAPAATLWLLPRVSRAGARWLGRAVVIAGGRWWRWCCRCRS